MSTNRLKKRVFVFAEVLALFLASTFTWSVGSPRLGDCSTAATERRDCYPWTENATAASCQARGCVWCGDDDADDDDGGIVCFYDDSVCPSIVNASARVECPSNPLNRDDCLRDGCVWCNSSSPGVPSCFIDADVSLGGDFCPSEIPVGERIDCHPEGSPANKTTCLARGCFWCPSAVDPEAPDCFSPRQHGYRMVDVDATETGFLISLERIDSPSWFGADIRIAEVQVEFQTDDRLRILITDGEKERFSLPLQPFAEQESQTRTREATDPQYAVTIASQPNFGLKVSRRATGAVVFDTTIGGLQLADQFLQIATRLDSPYLFGFGEHEHHNILHDMTWKRWAMWARDHFVQTDTNLYGHHSFYLNVEDSLTAANGVLFYNANAQDVTLMPAPGLTYRTTGGVLDIYIFFGPSPESVIQQYHRAIGLPSLVPYWALGFHLSRWGYTDLDHMKEAVDRMRQYDIPHDVQFADIDYMDGERDFTLDTVNFGGLPEYVGQLRSDGTRFIIILDPGISNEWAGNYTAFDEGDQLDIWIRNPDGVTPEEGNVWPGPVYYPDFTQQVTGDWWVNHSVAFRGTIAYDALWIDMNEPSNFGNGRGRGCNDTQWNYPPFTPSVSGGLYVKTICPDTIQQLGSHYNVHSLYGYSMSVPSLRAAREATGQRSFVLSRSSFPGSGKYAQHWLGDNFSQWTDLRWSIIGMLEFNMFGIPYVGADICGFTGSTTEELCQRWQQLGSFYTFARNHNAKNFPDQDPGVWPEVARVTRETLAVRYTVLPYLYTLFYQVHIQGGTVVRPLFFEFTEDVWTYNITDQFLWGPAFMISPVLDQGRSSVDVYFPDTRWFSYYDGGEVADRGSTITVDAPLDFIPLHIRGGFVLPTQQPDNCTDNSRLNPMGVIAALDDSGGASGSLFWDDGEALDTIANGNYFIMQYQVANDTLSGSVDGASDMTLVQLFDDIVVMGVKNVIGNVFVDGLPHSEWFQDTETMRVTISGLQLIIPGNFTVSWN